MQNKIKLPTDLATAHEMIRVQRTLISEVFSERDELKNNVEQAEAYLKRLLAENQRENPEASDR